MNAELAPRANGLEEGSGARLPCDQRETGSGAVRCCELSVNIGPYQLRAVLLQGTTNVYNSTLSAKSVVKQIKVCVLDPSQLLPRCRSSINQINASSPTSRLQWWPMGDYITYVHERDIRIPGLEMSPPSPAVASSNRAGGNHSPCCGQCEGAHLFSSLDCEGTMTSSSGNSSEQFLRLRSLTERVVSVMEDEGGHAAIPKCWVNSEASTSGCKGDLARVLGRRSQGTHGLPRAASLTRKYILGLGHAWVPSNRRNIPRGTHQVRRQSPRQAGLYSQISLQTVDSS